MAAFKRFRINRPKVIDEAFDNEVVIINFDTGSYYSLTKAGADVWGSIGAGGAVDEIVESLAGRYEGSRLNADLVALASPHSRSLLGHLPYPIPLLDETVE